MTKDKGKSKRAQGPRQMKGMFLEIPMGNEIH